MDARTSRYHDVYAHWQRSPEVFWAEASAGIDWYEKPKKIFDKDAGIYGRWFAGATCNTCYNALDRHVLAGRNDQLALIYDSPVTNTVKTFTYGRMLSEVQLLGAMLRDFGVEKGDRVIIYMPAVPEAVFAMLACARIGAIHSVVFGGFAAKELATRINDCKPKVILSASCGIEVARVVPYKPLLDEAINLAKHKPAACMILQRPQCEAQLTPGRDHDWRTVWENAVNYAKTSECVPVAATDPLYILYTSGTTGKPKGALATHRAVNSAVFTGAAAAARAFLRRGEAPPVADPTGPQRSILVSIPLFHVTGCMAALNPSLFAGAKLVMMYKWDTIRAFELIERERINSAGGVPTIAWQLIEHPARANYDLSSLESVGYGGAPAAPELVRKLREVFPNSMPGQGWGMTETCATVTSNGAEDYINRPDSCGPAAAVAELQIRDAADGKTVLGPGEVGELWSKGPMNCRAYWNKPEATAQTYVDGWVRTGDLARLDEEGFCYIIDRAKDMLIRGGENIYCVEIENVLYDHPAVMDAAIVGIPHRTLGEEPGAVVTLKPGAEVTEAELRAHVAERLAAFKVPVKVKFWDEVLPRNPNGKILKNELKKLFAADEGVV